MNKASHLKCWNIYTRLHSITSQELNMLLLFYCKIKTTFNPSKEFIIVYGGGGLPIKMTNFHASVIQYKIELHKNKPQL